MRKIDERGKKKTSLFQKRYWRNWEGELRKVRISGGDESHSRFNSLLEEKKELG